MSSRQSIVKAWARHGLEADPQAIVCSLAKSGIEVNEALVRGVRDELKTQSSARQSKAIGVRVASWLVFATVIVCLVMAVSAYYVVGPRIFPTLQRILFAIGVPIVIAGSWLQILAWRKPDTSNRRFVSATSVITIAPLIAATALMYAPRPNPSASSLLMSSFGNDFQQVMEQIAADAATAAEDPTMNVIGKIEPPAYSAVVTAIGKLFTWNRINSRRQFTDAKYVGNSRGPSRLATGIVRLGEDATFDGCRFKILPTSSLGGPGYSESERSQNFLTWCRHEYGGNAEIGFRFDQIEPGEYLILVGRYGSLFRIDREVIGENEVVRRQLEVDLSKVGKLEVALPDNWKPDQDLPADGASNSTRPRSHEVTVRVIAAEYRSPPIRLTRLRPFPGTALVDLPAGKFELRCGNSSAVVDVEPGRLKAVILESDETRKRDANNTDSMALFKSDLRRFDMFLRQCKANEAWQEGINAIKAMQESQLDAYGLLDRERDFHERAGAHAEAADVQRQLVEVAWDQSSNLNRIAWRIATGDAKEQLDLALKAALRASDLENHQAPDILDTVAEVYDAMGKLDESMSWRDRYVQAIWGDAEKLNEYASLLMLREGSHYDDLLIQAISRATELSKHKDPAILQTFAQVQHKRGNFAEALDWQQRLLNLDPADTQDAYPALRKYLVDWVKAGGETAVKLATLDGVGDEWRHSPPIWEEVGVDGGQRNSDCDLKRTYMANDEHCLYLFVEIEPAPRVRNAEGARTGAICKLYFDTDDNSKTGCKGVEGFRYGDIDGYEYRQEVDFGVYRRNDEYGWYVGCRINRIDSERRGSFFGNEVYGQKTFEPNALIAEGDDGIEFAIPLKTLGLKAGDQMRLLIQESADAFAQESFNQGRYTVTAAE